MRGAGGIAWARLAPAIVLALAVFTAGVSAGAMRDGGGFTRAAARGDPGGRVIARVDREEVTTVESLELTVEVRGEVLGEVGESAAMLDPEPVVGGEYGGFTVSWVRRDQPVVEGGEVVRRWVIGLEPFLAGEARIPPIGVASGVAVDDGEGGENGAGVVKSQEIVVRVRSVLEGVQGFEAGQARAPLDPAAPAEAEPGVAWWVWGAIGGASITLAAWGALAVRRRGRSQRQFRRAWNGLRHRAAAANAARDWQGAEEGVSVLREAAVLTLGERARAKSSEELAAWLRETGAAGDGREVEALLQWADARAYGGAQVEPPPVPDLARVVAVLEGISANAAESGLAAQGLHG